MGGLRQPVMPTAFLPPLKQLHSSSSGALSFALQYLTKLYLPDRPVDSFQRLPAIDSGYVSDDEDRERDHTSTVDHSHGEEEEEDMWDVARADPLERDFAMRWMTGFLARGLDWVEGGDGESELELEDREAVYDGISSLLSACSQASEAGALLREFVFPQPGVKHAHEVKVVLKDEDLNTTDHTGVGLQTWGSASIMAERLVRSPQLYGLVIPSTSSASRHLRILELGAGTGLLSLVIGSILIQSDVSAEIVATDHHPAVLANLKDNVAANPDSTSAEGGVSIAVEALDWELLHDDRDVHEIELGSRFADQFDVIIAADVVYRAQHAQWLASVARKLLRHPSSHGGDLFTPSFHLIVPSRPTHDHTHTSIQDAFSSPQTVSSAVQEDGDLARLDLQVVECVDHARVKGNGRADESGYREYRVEWR